MDLVIYTNVYQIPTKKYKIQFNQKLPLNSYLLCIAKRKYMQECFIYHDSKMAAVSTLYTTVSPTVDGMHKMAACWSFWIRALILYFATISGWKSSASLSPHHAISVKISHFFCRIMSIVVCRDCKQIKSASFT